MGKNIKTSFKDFLLENLNIDEEVKKIMLKSYEFGHFINAVELKYGKIVPLYHATNIDGGSEIELKLTKGKNALNFGGAIELLYFQIGRSDYVADNRPYLYIWDAPISVFCFANVDMDFGSFGGYEKACEKLEENGYNLENLDDIEVEMREALLSYINNGMSLEGM